MGRDYRSPIVYHLRLVVLGVAKNWVPAPLDSSNPPLPLPFAAVALVFAVVNPRRDYFRIDNIALVAPCDRDDVIYFSSVD